MLILDSFFFIGKDVVSFHGGAGKAARFTLVLKKVRGQSRHLISNDRIKGLIRDVGNYNLLQRLHRGSSINWVLDLACVFKLI